MGKPEEERQTGRSKTRFWGNVKIDLKEVGWRVCTDCSGSGPGTSGGLLRTWP